ncbi:hypothetical protein VARIO8X_60265 [Burkholderiales bacterium 8X]|nr:hypothetical protein VARIO8X_60265 [Burkholderiales bacterium 8X]
MAPGRSAGLCDHAAFRADQHRRPAARSRRAGGALSRHLDPLACRREQGRGEVGARTVPRRAVVPGRLQRFRIDARAGGLRALHPFRRRRSAADARYRHRLRGQPHQQSVPRQRLLRLRRRRSHRLSLRPRERRGRRHQLQSLRHHDGGLLRGSRGPDQAGRQHRAFCALVAPHRRRRRSAGPRRRHRQPAAGLRGGLRGDRPESHADARPQDRAGGQSRGTAVLDDRAGGRPADRTHGHFAGALATRSRGMAWRVGSPVERHGRMPQSRLPPRHPSTSTSSAYEHQERQVDPPHGRTERHDRTLRARPGPPAQGPARHQLRHLELWLRHPLRTRVQGLHQHPQHGGRPEELRREELRRHAWRPLHHPAEQLRAGPHRRVLPHSAQRADHLPRQEHLCTLRNHRQRHALRARVGRLRHARVQQHHAAAGQDLCGRGMRAGAVLRERRGLRDQLQGPGRQVPGPGRRHAAGRLGGLALLRRLARSYSQSRCQRQLMHGALPQHLFHSAGGRGFGARDVDVQGQRPIQSPSHADAGGTRRVGAGAGGSAGGGRSVAGPEGRDAGSHGASRACRRRAFVRSATRQVGAPRRRCKQRQPDERRLRRGTLRLLIVRSRAYHRLAGLERP